MNTVYAQVETTVVNPVTNITNLGSLFGWVLNLVMAVGFALVLVMLALGFVQYIMSRGDKTGVESAQKWVTYAVVGGIGLFLVFAIRQVVASLFGTDVGGNFGTGLDIVTQ